VGCVSIVSMHKKLNTSDIRIAEKFVKNFFMKCILYSLLILLNVFCLLIPCKFNMSLLNIIVKLDLKIPVIHWSFSLACLTTIVHDYGTTTEI
jgi:hypothetical protein